MKKIGVAMVSLIIALAPAGCGKSPTKADETTSSYYPKAAHTELERARAATARYHDLAAALADGYVDINVVKPNMGRHFMKHELVDGTFEIEKPEILVYASLHEHDPEHLVAVEYAIPLALAGEAPEGFTGDDDVWDPNQTFGLWLLHAWVWQENPDGVFAPMNPRVP